VKQDTYPKGRRCAESCHSIPLRGRAGEIKARALVDECDLKHVTEGRWSFNGSYAVRRINGRLMYLHRLLLESELGPGDTVDHINRDRLDNRRANLRVIPARWQPQNTSSHRDSTSWYRGVCGRPGRWIAQVGHGGHTVYLGSYASEVDAAAAAAQYRAEHLPYSVEDPTLLSRTPRRLQDQPQMLGWAGATAARLALMSTTLSQRAIAEMLGVSPGSIFAMTKGRAAGVAERAGIEDAQEGGAIP
jgi:DNA-binding transcriptional regulator YdaS (Cro superfamily)